jgi:hypothetical protein
LSPPPGNRWVNALLDAADRQDKLDRLREEMERRKTLAELAPPELPKVSEATTPKISRRELALHQFGATLCEVLHTR